MNNREIILMAIISGLLAWLFLRSKPAPPTYNIEVRDRVIEWPEMSYTVPVPEPAQVTIIEKTMPAEQIPDSLIRRLYNELAAKYDTLNQLREYTQPLEDTNATGKIKAKVRGELLGWSLDYKIKPVTIRDTTRIEYKAPRFEMFAGVGLSSQFQPSVGLMAQKDRYYVGADYQPLNQVVAIRAGVRLFKVK